MGTCTGVFYHLGGSQIQTLPYRFLHGFAFSSRLHHQYPVISPNCDYQLAVFAVISKQSGCYCRRYFADFKPAARCFRRNLAEVWLPWLQLFRRIWPSTRRFRLSFAGIWVLLSPSFRCISQRSRSNLADQYLAVFAAVSLKSSCHCRRYFAGFRPAARYFRRSLAEGWLQLLPSFRRISTSNLMFLPQFRKNLGVVVAVVSLHFATVSQQFG